MVKQALVVFLVCSLSYNLWLHSLTPFVCVLASLNLKLSRLARAAAMLC